jgi:ribosome-binding protein aMBF1 (putative translation factor)
MTRTKSTTDGYDLLYREFVQGKPEIAALLEIERVNSQVARIIYDLRNDAGLSQRQLAKLVGTTASVICRLEDADYNGHSLSMFCRIVAALHKSLEIRIVNAKRYGAR